MYVYVYLSMHHEIRLVSLSAMSTTGLITRDGSTARRSPSRKLWTLAWSLQWGPSGAAETKYLRA